MTTTASYLIKKLCFNSIFDCFINRIKQGQKDQISARFQLNCSLLSLDSWSLLRLMHGISVNVMSWGIIYGLVSDRPKNGAHLLQITNVSKIETVQYEYTSAMMWLVVHYSYTCCWHCMHIWQSGAWSCNSHNTPLPPTIIFQACCSPYQWDFQ